MKNANPESCPDQRTLLQYIQGLLEPPKLGHCEEHLSDCQSCHETLRGLDVNDTLSHHVSEAIQQSPADDVSDTQAIDGLIQRLLVPGNLGPRNGKGSNTEIMADKAAEVLRCIEPSADNDSDSLGSLGGYELLRLIGAGGTGVVFQAKDTSLDRIVALKVLRPSLGEIARERFIAEARLAASIDHDNVVTIYQIGQEDRLAFIAMQWTPGETLEERLNREPGPLDEVTVREFVSQIAAGLSAAHQRQLIHRDIKPANIWICDDTGRIKILDFGLARVADEESSLTQTGMLAGTPSFMSPEQTKGMELDPRSDLFSLGCVMYRLLTGRLPFSAPTVLGTLQTIQSDAPQPPAVMSPNCDADLSDLTMSLLEKLPGNRLASSESLIACLNSPRSQWPIAVAKATPSVASQEKVTTAKPKSKAIRGPGNWITAITLLGLLAVPGWLLAPQIYRIATNQGELVIETSDENVKVQVLKDGEVVNVLDSATGNSIEITAGEYTFNAKGVDKETEFKISPESVVLSRGGREVVSVSMNSTNVKTKGTVDTNANPDAAAFLSELMKEKNRIDNTFGKARTPEKLRAQLEAAIAGIEIQRDLSLDQYGSGHPTTQTFDRQIELMNNKLKELNVTTAPSVSPIYRGRDFSQWVQIAENDREPQTVADAIAACSFLAEGKHKEQFIALLRKLVRQHGTAHASLVNSVASSGGVGDTYFSGFVKAISRLEPDEIVEFVQTEIESGNERSLGFCSCMTGYTQFEDISNVPILMKKLKLDLEPLFARLIKTELEFDTNVQAFLDFGLLHSGKTSSDLALPKECIGKLDVEKRPWVYRSFMQRFRKGEFDEMVEADFFDPKTDGATRLSILHALETRVNGGGGGGFGSGGGGLGGGGMGSYPITNPQLLNRLLTRSIESVANMDQPELDFGTHAEFWYDDDGENGVSRDLNNNITGWAKKDGTLTPVKPEDIKSVRGRTAIVRHLLSRLCRNLCNSPPKDDDLEVVQSFVKKMTGSGTLVEQIRGADEFSELKIRDDLETIPVLLKGNAECDDFSKFVVKQNRGRFGGGGGGGVF